MILTVTLTMAAALAVLNVGLALRVSRARLAGREGAALDTAMRTHANLAEYAPFFLVLLGVIELAGGSSFWLWIAGVVFVVGRLAHAFGMGRPAPNPFRAGGALATWALLLLLAGWALAIAYAARVPAGPVIVEPASVRA